MAQTLIFSTLSGKAVYSDSALLRDASLLSFDVSAGERVTDKLAFAYGTSVRYATKIHSKPIKFELGFDKRTGGKLFGFDQHEERLFYSVTFNLFKSTSITFDRSITDNNIDYFDTNTPILKISYKAIY